MWATRCARDHSKLLNQIDLPLCICFVFSFIPINNFHLTQLTLRHYFVKFLFRFLLYCYILLDFFYICILVTFYIHYLYSSSLKKQQTIYLSLTVLHFCTFHIKIVKVAVFKNLQSFIFPEVGVYYYYIIIGVLLNLTTSQRSQCGLCDVSKMAALACVLNSTTWHLGPYRLSHHFIHQQIVT